MGETLLIVSVLLQAVAVRQAVCLALRQRRTGWVFLALANALMLARRGVTLFHVFAHGQPLDSIAEFIGLMISLLMVVGLTVLLAWPKQDEFGATLEAIQDSAQKRLKRQAILLAVFSLLGCAVLSHFAYSASRNAVTNRLLKGSLDLAHMLETAVRTAPNTPAALKEMTHLWQQAQSQYPNNFLIVIGRDGRVQLHSRDSEQIGKQAYPTNSSITTAQLPPLNFTQHQQDWAGRISDQKGHETISAFAYSSNLNATVSVHLPAESVDEEIHAAALPWGVGIALIFVFVLPLSFGLLYYVGSASEKAALQAMRRRLASEQQYALLTENVKDHAIFLLDAKGCVTTWNSGAEQLRGWTSDEIKGKHFSVFYSPEDIARNQPERDLEEVAKSGSITTDGWRVRKDGSSFWASVTVAGGPKKTNQELGYLVVARDLTEQKRAEEALRESENMLKAILTSLTAHIAVLDQNGKILVVNPAWEVFAKKNGNPPAERVAAGVNYLEICRRSQGIDASDALAGILRVLKGEEPEFTMEYRCDSPQTARYFLMTVSPLRRSGGGAVISHIDISERKRAEAAQRESLERLQIVARATNDIIWDWDLKNDSVWWNESLKILLGYKESDIEPTAQFWIDGLHPEDREHVLKSIHDVIDSQQSAWLAEYRFRRQDGSYAEVLDRGYVLRDEEKKSVRMIGAMQDITERKGSEKRIHHLNRVYAVLSDINTTIVRERDPHKIFQDACEIAVKKGGFRMAWIGMVNHEKTNVVAHAGATPATLEKIELIVNNSGENCHCHFTRQAIATGAHSICNNIFHHPQAECWRDAALRRDYQAMASLPLKIGTETVGTFNLYADEVDFFDDEEMRLLDELSTDISFALEINRREKERQIAEAARDALLLLETKLSATRTPVEAARRIFEVADELWTWDAGGLDVYLPEQDLTQAILNLDIIDGERREIWNKQSIASPTPRFRRIMTQGAELLLRPLPAVLEPDAISFGDTNRPSASLMAVPIRWNGQPAGMLSIQSYSPNAFTEADLRILQGLADHCGATLERIRSQEILRGSEERFRQLAETIEEVFWMIDFDSGQLLYLSPAYEKIWGLDCENLAQARTQWMESIHPEDRERVLRSFEEKQATGEYNEIYRIKRPDETERWIHDRAFPVRDHADKILRLVGTAEDITKRRHLEEQFRQSQKMEAIGQLAGGVAHDFNNILAAIMMQADIAAMGKNLPAETSEMLEDIKSATERAANLTRQLLAFSRRQVMQPQQLDLNEVVTSLIKMLQRIVGEDIRLQLNLCSNPLMTRADAGMIDQVLLNLVVNARDAMPGGGQLIIETSEKILTLNDTARIPDATPGPHVCFCVTDTGTGISAAHQARIFEPFFTTKEPGKGTGLGLATVFGIVKQHNGSLDLESHLGKGTTFKIFLPATEKFDVPAEKTKQETRSYSGTETILLVEDEPSVRMLTRLVLEREGYHILEAGDGLQAMHVWEKHHESIQLLLTDIVMPEGMSGRELSNRIHDRAPNIPVIFTSGYSADIAGRELSLQEGQNFLQKPFSPNQLLALIRRSLDRS